MSQQVETVYEFGPFRVDSIKRVLSREGEMVPLTSKSLDTLLVLMEHRGQVVTKDYLMKALWPDTVVEENNLTQQVSMLRKALGEKIREHRYLVTVPGRGYSFVAEVIEQQKEDMDLIVEQHIRSTITVDVAEEHEQEVLSLRSDSRFLPDNRFTPNKRGLLSARTIVFGSILLAISTLLVVWVVQRRLQPSTVAETRKSIAVLPFRALNTDPANDYLTTGIADALITKLSNIRQISVRPTSAIIKYTGPTQEARAIGRELGVDAVLEGTVQSVGQRVRVTVQLVNVKDSSPLWAKTFDGTITDIFAVQDAISAQVAQALMVKLDSDERKRLGSHETESVEAYQEYLRGRYFWNLRDREGLTKSLIHFQQAIKLDANYAQAYAGLADAYTLLIFYKVDSVPQAEGFALAKAAALKALSIDETLAEAHTSLALIASRYDHDKSGAETSFKRALALNPNYATAHHWYSEYLAMNGRDAEAMSEIKLAQELDPLSPVINTTLAEFLYYSRQYDEAIVRLRKTLEVAPDFAAAHFALGLALEQKGEVESAIVEFQKSKGAEALDLSAAASLGHMYALSGHEDKAREILRDLLNNKKAEPYQIALVYQGLADNPQTIGWLKKIKDRRGEINMLLKLDPRLDSLRPTPEFQALL